MRVKAFVKARGLLSRADAEIEYEADTIEDMEKLMELAKKFIDVNIRMS